MKIQKIYVQFEGKKKNGEELDGYLLPFHVVDEISDYDILTKVNNHLEEIREIPSLLYSLHMGEVAPTYMALWKHITSFGVVAVIYIKRNTSLQWSLTENEKTNTYCKN